MKELLTMLTRLQFNHESFLKNFPDDVSTEEGKIYCINNLIRESIYLLDTLSHRLVVDKCITAEEAEDMFIAITCSCTEWMDNYTNRNKEYYERKIEEMINDINMKEGDNE